MTETSNQRCNGSSSCKYQGPHQHESLVPRQKILPNILHAIGNTPLVSLDRFAKHHGLKCQLLAKCEFMNPGGSVKDRIGYRMVEEAEKSGRIKPGDTLIEPTSGNTGIGLALAAALKGYRMIITLPMKMSLEKVNVLKALGAEIIRTPTEAAWDSPESHISVAKRLNQQIPNSHILDQYSNVYNPLAHYDATAEEIIDQCDGKLDMIVMTAGTGGTLSGVARKIKEKCPACKVVGVDPHGSILALPDTLNTVLGSYKVEGIGYDFVPEVCDRECADIWVKSSDKESFLLSRQLIKEEGLLCGGSSGSAIYGVLQAAKDLDETKRVVVLLPDSVRNYMSKFLDPSWMIENDFADESLLEATNQVSEWWSNEPVGGLRLDTPCTILPTVTCHDAIKIMSDSGFGQLPVVDPAGLIVGTVTEGNLLAKTRAEKILPTDPVTKALYKDFKKVDTTCTLGKLASLFDHHSFVLVVASSKRFKTSDSAEIVEIVVGVATRIDLLNYIMSKLPSTSK
eukprot:c17671_g1_i1.p1 GENE.c17671_g1_i1~~c17671_g1_i1.p1  ORF type:complete len:534 (-),score=124.99 c17671_g1_i1:289-1821(-)